MTIEEVHRLIKKGEAIRLRIHLSNGLDPNLCNRGGFTLLMSAALHGNSLIGKLLLEFGADIEAKTQRGETALLLAPFGSARFFNLLLIRGAAFDERLESHLAWMTSFFPERMLRITEAIAKERERRAELSRTLETLRV